MDDQRAVVARRRLGISSRVPAVEGGTEWPCVWCLEPTDITAATPFRPDLGAVPLHLTCGADLIAVARRWEEAGELPIEAFARLSRVSTLRAQDEPWGGLLGTGEPQPEIERALGTRPIGPGQIETRPACRRCGEAFADHLRVGRDFELNEWSCPPSPFAKYWPA